jgi:ABC-2 type transport system ATP-binding protein
VIFLDEPMSGLDPLGRKQVREIIIQLRERGCTVFFSSHILSDAEALCSRVAIVAQGRLVASGRMTDILAFELKGWELVVSHVSEELKVELEQRATRVTALTDGRYTMLLPADSAPEQLMHHLASQGGHIVSLNPVRETLEDLFVQSVTGATPRATERL